LQKLASQTLSAYPAAFTSYRPIKVIGNPLREEFLSIPEPDAKVDVTAKLKILVLGGSQGAAAINATVLSWLQQYALADTVELRHQCGVKDLPELQRAYAALDVIATADDFIDDMVAAYCWADIVIGRSGALTVAEIAAVGVASILVPFPYAVDNHQYHNAKYLEDAAAAKIVLESELTPEVLSTVLLPLIDDREAVLTMAKAAGSVAKLSATNDCLAVLEPYVRGENHAVLER
jgi:UDP-N-acetylglucosamine--N-acetylmuramyl-(pentapeptide) pyrophosphoryl-undecaprenol N-acetylglucosamine transferase